MDLKDAFLEEEFKALKKRNERNGLHNKAYFFVVTGQKGDSLLGINHEGNDVSVMTNETTLKNFDQKMVDKITKSMEELGIIFI